MVNQWTPSFWGRQFTRSSKWCLNLQGFILSLSIDGLIHHIDIKEQKNCSVHKGLFWTDIILNDKNSQIITIDGLPNAQAAIFLQVLDEIYVTVRLQGEITFINQTVDTINDWLAYKTRQEDKARQQRRWITHEMQLSIEAIRPDIDNRRMAILLRHPQIIALLASNAQAVLDTLEQWGMDHRLLWDTMNAEHTARELIASKAIFDGVERQPLTVEQAKAVICFDNRVQVIASAGSGKTSTMVAKAVYAIERNIAKAEDIVLLAFNKQAAEELSNRCRESFGRLGFQGVNIEATTFHALGLRIVAKVTGKKPNVPVWAIDQMAGIHKLRNIAERLTTESIQFFVQWHLFRFVFGGDLPEFGASDDANTWDAQGNGFILTIDSHRVRSQEEATLCNWLFLNGVNYCYEPAYEHDTADEHHHQYHPDFYYPDIGLYHEHFALDAEGNPPVHFTDYLAGVEWKRHLHKTHGTEMIETTSDQLRSGDAFRHLAHELTSRGIELKPDPNRKAPANGEVPMKQDELLNLMRIFINHAKSNNLSIEAIRQRFSPGKIFTFPYRYQLFLSLIEPVLREWDTELAQENGIDFEDMLNVAAEYLETGRYTSPYRLVMADEFQDASRARARLCRALTHKPGHFLFTVGDDWQSINRFAGADQSVMTAFREWFGQGQVLKLEQTFRCPQSLCDISSRFISQNPNQISKNVRSETPTLGAAVQAFQVTKRDHLASAIDNFIIKLANDAKNGDIPKGRKGKISVFVLGRYNSDRQYLPDRVSRFNEWLDVSFLTIHRSKGSEADYVILPEMVTTHRGRSFPNSRSDDPLLSLAMPESDNFPHSEERRLFYVALTRARRSVAMFTVKGQCSVFVEELRRAGALSITDTAGNDIAEALCPACQQGVIILRHGPYGNFHACSNYPDCCYKPPKWGSTQNGAATSIIPQAADAAQSSQ